MFCVKFQVRRATQVYWEALVFLAFQDRQVHLAAGVQAVFQDWTEVQVFVTNIIYY